MSLFIDSLCITEISDSIFEICDHPLRYKSDVARRLFTVPVGFFTDFASVPRWIPIIYSMLGNRGHMAAAVHDWLYYSAVVPRKMADKVIKEAIEVCGISRWRANLFYAGVRVGGWKAWNDHRKAGDPESGKFKDSPDILNKRVNQIESSE